NRTNLKVWVRVIKAPEYGKRVIVQFGKNDASIKNVQSFLNERFRVFFPDYRQCTLIGSTSMYMIKGNESSYLKNDLNKNRSGDHLVCDSFKSSLPIFSQDYKILQVRTAVADGLGYEENDSAFNLSVATISENLTEAWVSTNFPFDADRDVLKQ